MLTPPAGFLYLGEKEIMSYRIRKILVEFVRSTSHTRPAFRFEVPILKLLNPQEKLNIHANPNPNLSDVHEFAGPREAFLSLQTVYGPKLLEAYLDFQAFDEAFKATAQRDSVGQTVGPAIETESPDAAKLEAVATMAKIRGVGPEIAVALFDGGYRSIEDVARSTLDELEAVPGIGPATSTTIQIAAKQIVLGSLGEKLSEGPEMETGTGTSTGEKPETAEPGLKNPFE